MAQKKSSRTSHARIVAGSVLVVLILLLFGLGAVLINVLRPPGAPKTGSLDKGMTWVRSIYGFGPRADQQLFAPIGVAVDAQGRIYVSEPQRSRIVVFKRDGSFDGLITLMKNHDVSMARPVGMDVDDAGNLYVADKALERIIVFGADRKWVRNIKEGAVTGVTVAGDRLYGVSREHVSIYNLKGELLSRFGKMGREPGQLDGAYALAVGDDGLLYVAESFNKRVSVFKRNGDFVRVIGRQASSSRSVAATSAAASKDDTSKVLFDLPTGLVVDGSGRFVSLDAFLFQLSVFDKTGKVAGSYGDQGTTDGKMVYPSGLAYDRAGDVFVVTDTRNNRVQVFRLDGSGSRRLDRMVPESFFQPVCYGPLALLLLAVIATVLASRKGHKSAPEVADDETGSG